MPEQKEQQSLADFAENKASETTKNEEQEEVTQEPTTEEEQQPDVLSQLKEATGLDVESVEDLAAHLDSMRTGSQYWQAFQDRIKGREEELADFLEGKKPEPEKPVKPADIEVGDIRQFRMMREALLDENGNPKKDADREQLAALNELSEKMADTSLKIAKDPKAFIREHFADELASMKDEVLNQVRGTLTQSQQERDWEAARNQINEKHADKLFEGGDPTKPTEYCNKVNDIIRRFHKKTPDGEGWDMNKPENYALAFEIAAQQDKPKAQPTRQTATQGSAPTAVAKSRGPVDADLAEKRKSMSLAEYVELVGNG